MKHECFKCKLYRRLLGLAQIIDGLTLLFLPWHSWLAMKACIAIHHHNRRQDSQKGTGA